MIVKTVPCCINIADISHVLFAVRLSLCINHCDIVALHTAVTDLFCPES